MCFFLLLKMCNFFFFKSCWVGASPWRKGFFQVLLLFQEEKERGIGTSKKESFKGWRDPCKFARERVTSVSTCTVLIIKELDILGSRTSRQLCHKKKLIK